MATEAMATEKKRWEEKQKKRVSMFLPVCQQRNNNLRSNDDRSFFRGLNMGKISYEDKISARYIYVYIYRPRYSILSSKHFRDVCNRNSFAMKIDESDLFIRWPLWPGNEKSGGPETGSPRRGWISVSTFYHSFVRSNAFTNEKMERYKDVIDSRKFHGVDITARDLLAALTRTTYRRTRDTC